MTGLLLTVNNDRSLDFVADSDFHFYVNPSTWPTGCRACLASPPLFLFRLFLCCYWGGRPLVPPWLLPSSHPGTGFCAGSDPDLVTMLSSLLLCGTFSGSPPPLPLTTLTRWSAMSP